MLMLAVLVALTAAGAQRALLVAVGNYPAGSGWQRLNSLNDVELLRPALAQRGYRVTTLTDAQATRVGIISAINTLTRQCAAGDRVWLHFSGHGQQVEDIDGDEPDGLDEAFVPYDAERYYSDTYHGQRHLLDDDLHPLLLTLRKRVGPRGEVMVTIDACHSGDSYRGGDDIAPDTLVGARRGNNNVITRDGRPYVRRQASARATRTTPGRAEGYAPIAMLGACQPDECNYEYVEPGTRRSYGALTYMLREALGRTAKQAPLADIARWVMNYNSFYMRKYQQPHLFLVNS